MRSGEMSSSANMSSDQRRVGNVKERDARGVTGVGRQGVGRQANGETEPNGGPWATASSEHVPIRPVRDGEPTAVLAREGWEHAIRGRASQPVPPNPIDDPVALLIRTLVAPHDARSQHLTVRTQQHQPVQLAGQPHASQTGPPHA